MMRFFLKLLLLLLTIYGIFWLFSFKSYPVTYGLSFDIDYASYLKLDWKKTYTSILDDLHPKSIRIAASWSEIENKKGTYDFSRVDFLVNEANKRGTKLILVVGQKVPHWPECHFPEWSKEDSKADRRPELLQYVKAVVDRYKNNPAIEMWQVENEPFISFNFGECTRFDPEAIKDEIVLVRQLDSSHKILVTDSGELSTWSPAAKSGDVFGTTLYRVVRTPGGIIVTYDWLPSSFYKLKARVHGLTPDKFFVAELQAEPWIKGGILDNTIAQQKETFSINRFQKNISYAQHVGASRAYLWGAEWWYWMKTTQNDSSYWEYAKEVLKN